MVTLLGAFLVLCLLGVTVPQQNSAEHDSWAEDRPALARFAAATGLDDVYRSPLFLALVSVAGLSLVSSMVFRVVDFRRGRPARVWLREMFLRPRFLGSLVFHAGILGVVIASAISALTRSEGKIVLTEGQVLAIDAEQISNAVKPIIKGAWRNYFNVRLDKFHPVHQGRWGTPDYAADLTVLHNGDEVRQKTVRVNEPLIHRTVTLYQRKHGFSPLIVLTDDSGRRRFGSWVALETDLSAGETRYADDFVIPGTSLAVEAELFPDAYMVGNRLASRSPNPENCILDVTVREGAKEIYRGPVHLGKTVDLGSGRRLGFPGVRYWCGFDTVRDRGTGALFVSAWIAVIGLCIRFMPLPRAGDNAPAGGRVT